MIEINITNDYGKRISFHDAPIKKILKNLLDSQDIIAAKISVILSNKLLLNKLKKNYFNVDQFTDVIAFNLEDKNASIDGEIYISIDDVLSNSVKYEQSFNLEFKRVLIHGTLYLMGFEDDSDEEKNIMTKLEDKYLRINKHNVISHI